MKQQMDIRIGLKKFTVSKEFSDALTEAQEVAAERVEAYKAKLKAQKAKLKNKVHYVETTTAEGKVLMKANARVNIGAIEDFEVTYCDLTTDNAIFNHRYKCRNAIRKLAHADVQEVYNNCDGEMERVIVIKGKQVFLNGKCFNASANLLFELKRSEAQDKADQDTKLKTLNQGYKAKENIRFRGESGLMTVDANVIAGELKNLDIDEDPRLECKDAISRDKEQIECENDISNKYYADLDRMIFESYAA